MQLLESIEDRIGPWAIRFRWAIILTTLSVVVLCGLGLPKSQFQAGYRPLFNADDPKLVAYDQMEARFTRNDNVLIAVAPPDGDIFSRQSLVLMQELTELAWEVPFAGRVDSLTNFQNTRADGDDIYVGDLVEGNPLQLSDSALAAIRNTALTEPDLAGLLVSPDGSVAAANVTLNLAPDIQADGQTSVTVNDFAQDIAQQIRNKYPGSEVYVSGQTIVDYAFFKVAEQDAETLVPLSMALMLIIYMVLTRNILGTILTAVVIAGAVIISLGSAAHLGIPFHTGNAASPTIILTIAGASCVHLLVSYLHNIRTMGNNRAAIIEAMRVNFQPIAVTSVTSAIGFLALLSSDIPSFRVLSILVATGVISSLFLVTLFFPAVLSFFPDRKALPLDNRADEVAAGSMKALGIFVVKYRNKLLLAMLFLNLALAAGIFRNQVNDNFVMYFDTSVPLRASTDYINEHLSGMYTVQMPLTATSGNGVNDPAFLSELEKLKLWLEAQPEVLHVRSVSNTYKRLNKAMHGDNDEFYRLPTSAEEAAQYLLLYEMSLPYGLDLNNMISLDKTSTRVITSMQTMGSLEFIAFKDRYLDWMASNIRHMTYEEPTSAIMLFSEKSHHNSINMIVTTSIALAGISVILILVFRSVSLGLVSLIPNLIPAAMGYGLWGYIDGEITIVLSLVMTMTLGIVVDDTVHFLSKFLRARREKNLGVEDAVIYSFQTVGQALIVTSIMLSAGFFLLTLSPFQLNYGMGFLTGLVILFALLADFFFLPQLLMKLKPK